MYIIGLQKLLAEASEQGDIKKVKALLDTNKVNSDSQTSREGIGKGPLHIACTYGQTEIVEELLMVRIY